MYGSRQEWYARNATHLNWLYSTTHLILLCIRKDIGYMISHHVTCTNYELSSILGPEMTLIIQEKIHGLV